MGDVNMVYVKERRNCTILKGVINLDVKGIEVEMMQEQTKFMHYIENFIISTCYTKHKERNNHVDKDTLSKITVGGTTSLC